MVEITEEELHNNHASYVEKSPYWLLMSSSPPYIYGIGMMFDKTSPIPGIINHSPEVDLIGSKSMIIDRNLFRVFLGPPSIT